MLRWKNFKQVSVTISNLVLKKKISTQTAFIVNGDIATIPFPPTGTLIQYLQKA